MASPKYSEQLTHAAQFKQVPRVGLAVKNLDAVQNPPVNGIWGALSIIRVAGSSSYIPKPSVANKLDIDFLRVSELAPKTGTDTKDKGIYYEKIW